MLRGQDWLTTESVGPRAKWKHGAPIKMWWKSQEGNSRAPSRHARGQKLMELALLGGFCAQIAGTRVGEKRKAILLVWSTQALIF